jgi:hypothetical protein
MSGSNRMRSEIEDDEEDANQEAPPSAKKAKNKEKSKIRVFRDANTDLVVSIAVEGNYRHCQALGKHKRYLKFTQPNGEISTFSVGEYLVFQIYPYVNLIHSSYCFKKFFYYLQITKTFYQVLEQML